MDRRDDLDKARKAKDNFWRFAEGLNIVNADGSRPRIIASRPVRNGRDYYRYLRTINSELLES